ncbi:MAG: hypothetical protein JF615_15440 [Asticcacaulis sp.]|nr:hypothetical protein [Asticcacaulis sp.]
MSETTMKGFGGIIILLALLVVAWGVLTMPDQRSAGQRIGDAVDTLPQGVDKAGRELEKRTPGERLGDAVKDAGDDIKKNTDR